MAEHERLFRPERAHKLDDPERLKWLPPEVVVRQLAHPGLRVADVGAGSGYFALPLAPAVPPGGRVFAVDLQPEMLQILRARVPPELPVVLVDWRPDVEQPPGPPLDHRIPASEVARTLHDNGWRVDTSEAIGPYNYFIVAVGDRRP
jgi:SAM-dependent methyltransferase